MGVFTIFDYIDDLETTEDKLTQRSVLHMSVTTDKKLGTLYVMSGYPGSGKTTFIRRDLPEAIRVCLDDLYKMMRATYDIRLTPLYHDVEDGIIASALTKGYDVAVDRTCLDKRTRQRFILLGKSLGTKTVCIVMQTPLEVAKKWNRNADRMKANHFVSDKVFQDLQAKFEPVTEDEGFDSIRNIKYVGGSDV